MVHDDGAPDLEAGTPSPPGRREEPANRYQGLFDSLADPVLVFDGVSHRFLDCNPAALRRYGYTLEEILRLTPRDLLPPRHARAVAPRLAQGPEPSLSEHTHVTKDGTAFPVEIHTARLNGGEHPVWISIVRDISDRKAAEQQASRLLQNQARIASIGLTLCTVMEPSAIFARVYNEVRTLMDADTFIVSSYNSEARELRARYIVTDGKPFEVAVLPPLALAREGSGTQSEVIYTGKPQYYPDYRAKRKTGKTEYAVDDAGHVTPGPPPDDAERTTRSAVFVPMNREGQTTGVIQVHSYWLNAYTQQDIDLLGILANVAAEAVRNAELVAEIDADARRLRAMLDGTITALAATVETRDPYTAGHQRRVAELACAMADEIGLPADQVHGIRVAGLLHDIGKMAVPADILSKPTKLSELERALIERHPEVAHEILTTIAFPWPVADIVLQHHERVDESGYPRKLSGDEILIQARILAVADVVEAMSSHRPYRPALGIDFALQEIEEHRGSSYDPLVVEACVTLFRHKGFLLPA